MTEPEVGSMDIDKIRAQHAAMTNALATFTGEMKKAFDQLAQRAVELGAQAASILALLAPAPTAGPLVRNARFIYNDPDVDSRWGVQVVQGQPETVRRVPALRQAGVEQIYRYAFPLTWSAHPDYGYRSAVDPDAFKREWLAQRNGSVIPSTKFRSGPEHPNYLIDVGNIAYQQASAEWLIRKCKIERYDGAYLDEIIESLSYAGYRVPSKYGTDYQFQQAILRYVQYVAKALQDAGFSCHANVASNANAWRTHLGDALNGVCLEFFMVQHTVTDPDAWHAASLENGEWARQVDWVLWNEARGKHPICQADARSEDEVEYALASLLLVTDGGSYFAATKGGADAGAAWWTSAMDTARRLGRPRDDYTVTTGGLEVATREFEHGVVLVNRSEKPAGGMPPTTGRIKLDAP